jgi:adenine-specific DNA-methyltransferase
MGNRTDTLPRSLIGPEAVHPAASGAAEDPLPQDARCDAPERAYAAEADPARRRSLAQFFTPFPLARFMARWVLSGPRAAALLDPALGLGVFARAAAAESQGVHRLLGHEIDPLLAHRARGLLAALPERFTAQVVCGDYLESDWDVRFGGILANPPWLRFQEYAAREARLKSLEDRMGVRLGGLTNLHGLFLLKSLHQLEEEGRAAFLMPSEFLNAGYGRRIKEYLLSTRALRHAVLFDDARGLFPGAVTTACVLLLAKDGRASDVAFHRAAGTGDLDALYRTRISARPAAHRAGPGEDPPGIPAGPGTPGAGIVLPAGDLDAGTKWKGYWRETSPVRYRNAVPLSEFASVLRGIATGCNGFFLLSEAARLAAGLPPEALLPCISKARDADSPVFARGDFEALKGRGRPVWLLDAVGSSHPAVAAYLVEGRRLGADLRFLTRNRKPWYALENRPPAPLWMPVFHRGGHRPVLNRAAVRNLTAFHCLYPRPGAGALVDVLFAFLFTAAGRASARAEAREYGAGLEKLEPKDLAGTPVPDFARMAEADLDAVREAVGDEAAAERVLAEVFAPYL